MGSSERGNEDYPWHEFDTRAYLEHNYAVMREDDRHTLTFVRDFFVEAFAADPGRAGRRGIDVGTGANLYPALAMLPFCDQVTLYEYSKANIDWLTQEKAENWPSWSQIWARFWLVLAERTAYTRLAGHPRLELARCTDVTLGSVYDLRGRDERWDVGTMFFVAESITARRNEFVAAVQHFLDVLRPGSPFAIAFMEHSTGYHVGGRYYPAIAVDRNDVMNCLDHRAFDVLVEHIGAGDNPLRNGYSGMIVACGRVKDTTDSSRPEGV